jgi:hypothetical protein
MTKINLLRQVIVQHCLPVCLLPGVFSLALIVVKFIISHDVVFDRSDIKQVVVVSAIAATAAGVRSWLYALLDERKIRKKPRSMSSLGLCFFLLGF